jgi:hypothetical protein
MLSKSEQLLQKALKNDKSGAKGFVVLFLNELKKSKVFFDSISVVS